MNLQFGAAKAISATLTWGLRTVFHRPAANTPGKIALYADPRVIAHARPRLGEGSVVVVGTNGKTTVTNLLADVVEKAGLSVVCNRTGANLDSGVATVLLQSKGANWGVFESDELWLAKILPHLQANYVVLLNLFRDQLDRCGEVDRIQESIVGALAASPRTVLVYNADDPQCAMVARRAAEQPGRADTPSIAFGVSEAMSFAQEAATGTVMCQECSATLAYDFRQYDQLGAYRCPSCGFTRPEIDFAARDVKLGNEGLSFATSMRECNGAHASLGETHAAATGAYMVYNLLAVRVLAHVLGCSAISVQQAIDAFNPRNGRLQEYAIGERRVLLNLAKNPTGFNQNLRIVEQDGNPKAVAFFVNDKEGDGRDVSWIWDVDFEALASQEGCAVFAGGIRRNDLQVRLKYAGVAARLVDGIENVFAALPALGLPKDANVYAIANYTALPVVHAGLDALAAQGGALESGTEGSSGFEPASKAVPSADSADAPACAEGAPAAVDAADARAATACGDGAACASCESAQGERVAEKPLVMVDLFPDLLNLYGGSGNARVLEQRCRWRGIPVELRCVRHGERFDLSDADLVLIGGGFDREQRLAFQGLASQRDDLERFIDGDGVVLAVCGGYEMLGRMWPLGDEEVAGLGLFDCETCGPASVGERLVGDIVLNSPLSTRPVVGYENHEGRTKLGAGVQPFGAIAGGVGKGNDGSGAADGIIFRNVVGTYVHGPLLPKNPEVADALLQRALRHRAGRLACATQALSALDDAEEIAANDYMSKRLGASN